MRSHKNGMSTQISKPETMSGTHTDRRIPSTLRAVVYHGINDMRVETVPVPRVGPG